MDKLKIHKAVFDVRQTFEKELSSQLNLVQLLAPKFIKSNTGIQDDLARTCEPVKFHLPSCGFDVEMVHSLAKWKRIMLSKYNLPSDSGIYVNMDAVRKDEIVDDIHSVYVDQLDWEINMGLHVRNELYLRDIVQKIYSAIQLTEEHVNQVNILGSQLHNKLPQKIHFIHSDDLYYLYPKYNSKRREQLITQKYGAVFVIGIGHKLKSGEPHDLRAFDYDDWSLNGDILVWDDVRKDVLELSSMGIRVDSDTLLSQSKLSGQSIDTHYHKLIMNKSLPQSIGGGIGHSRLAMFLLEKKHIGEVQVSEWPNNKYKDVYLL